MNKDTTSRIEELYQLPTAATLPPADNNPIPPIHHSLLDPIKLGRPLEVGDLFPQSNDEFDEEDDEDLLNYEPSPTPAVEIPNPQAPR
jgi:hypothetical protein